MSGCVQGEGEGTPRTLQVETIVLRDPAVRETTDYKKQSQIFSESSSRALLHGFSSAKS